MNAFKISSYGQRIEAAWSNILPTSCFVSCGEIENTYPPLTQVERSSFEGALSLSRLKEIEAGRYHAKSILKKLNNTVLDLPRSQLNAAPQWPKNIKGCITHTKTNNLSHVAVVATDSKNINVLGIDAEIFLDLNPNMWITFMRQDELDWLSVLKPNIRTSIVKKIWCLKEAGIKALNQANMMSLSVHPNNQNMIEFTLTNHNLPKDDLIIGRAIEVDKITLAAVYV